MITPTTIQRKRELPLTPDALGQCPVLVAILLNAKTDTDPEFLCLRHKADEDCDKPAQLRIRSFLSQWMNNQQWADLQVVSNEFLNLIIFYGDDHVSIVLHDYETDEYGGDSMAPSEDLLAYRGFFA